MFEEGSLNEDSKNAENINLEELDKDQKEIKTPEYPKVERLDLKAINSFLPPINLSKNGSFCFSKSM
jgi:hypothetical protein